MDVSGILAIIIIALGLVGGIIVGIKLKKKMNNEESTKTNLDKIDAKSQLIKHVPYLWPKELEFYDMFRVLLPQEFLMVPKVGVDKIVKPHGSLVMYNAVKSKYVDFCIFKRSNMEPIAVIDCFYPSITDSTMKEMDKVVVKALNAVSVPVVTYEILDIPYDKDKVLKQFYEALDPASLAQLIKK